MERTIIDPKDDPREKRESSKSIDFQNKEGAWHATQAEARSQAILDPVAGQDIVIRIFKVYPPPERNVIMEETLHGLMPMLKENAAKDGWTFFREPTIQEAKEGDKKVYVITTVLTPGFKNGLRIGATNATARSATELLKEAQGRKNKK